MAICGATRAAAWARACACTAAPRPPSSTQASPTSRARGRPGPGSSRAPMSLPLQGPRHAAAMTSYRNLAQVGLMVSDSSRGRVHVIAGRPVIRYDLEECDLARLRSGLSRMQQLMLAAGAREVYLPLPA